MNHLKAVTKRICELTPMAAFKTIELADVLMAIARANKNIYINCVGNIFEESGIFEFKITSFSFDLSKPLSEQDQSTINFLHNIFYPNLNE